MRAAYLHGFPAGLQLSSLALYDMGVQLLPGGGMWGVLGEAVAASLTRLQLHRCTLVDHPLHVSAALQALPQLQHFELYMPRLCSDVRTAFSANGVEPAFALPNEVTQHLQHLTFLKLGHVHMQALGYMGLKLLTNLRDLQVTNVQPNFHFGGPHEWYSITADMLTGMQQLTKLQLQVRNFGQRCLNVKPGMLSPTSHLQHLSINASLDPLSGWTVGRSCQSCSS